ncbi:hypothetical protein BU25DRAFT_481051, partial [Macroventuria anomochaeta]
MSQGRPRKYATAIASKEARKERDRLRYLQKHQPQCPPEFIAYEPLLPGDIPRPTPTNTGLRISSDIPIPRDRTSEHNPTLLDKHPEWQLSAAPSPVINDPEYTREVEELQEAEKEQNTELAEHNAAIAECIQELDDRVREPLMELEGLYQNTSTRNTPQQEEQEEQEEQEKGDCTSTSAGAGNYQAAAWERVCEEKRRNRHTQNSSITVTAAQTEGVGQEDDSSSLDLQDSATPTQTVEQQQSPNQGASIASLPSSTTSKKRKSPFPTQSNTLLSYFQPRPTSISPAIPRTPQPAHLHSISRTPQLGHQPSVGSVTEPEHHSSAGIGTQTESVESTASKLARQLCYFHGCTHQDHAEQELSHNRHHQRDDVHSECSSFESITRLLCGDYNNGTPLPDVLSNPCFKRAEGLADGIDCQGAFEGTSPIALPDDSGTRNEKLPLSLCMSKYYQSSTTARVPKTTFDIDSLCCFPSSLGFARQGIHWLPYASTVLNLSHNIHFSLKVPTYNPKGELCQTDQPLHKIPHYCFGTAIGMESVQIYIFFPELHLGSGNEHSTFLCNEDFKLWYDSVLMPAIQKSVADSNVLQHYPVSAEVARLDATVLSAETFAKKSSSREQLLKYALQPQHLHQIWTCIQDSVACNPLFSRFRGAALFAHSKNTKLEYMTEDLSTTFCKWQNSWSRVTDPQFCSKDSTFVDLGKQVTSEDSNLLHNTVPS